MNSPYLHMLPVSLPRSVPNQWHIAEEVLLGQYLGDMGLERR